MEHTFNVDDWNAKKQAKEDLNQPHTPPNSVPQLRSRVDKLERLLNVTPNEE